MASLPPRSEDADPPETSNAEARRLIRRITPDETPEPGDLEKEFGPVIVAHYESAKVRCRAELERATAEGCELWTWRRGDDLIYTLGVATVREGKIVEWWVTFFSRPDAVHAWRGRSDVTPKP